MTKDNKKPLTELSDRIKMMVNNGVYTLCKLREHSNTGAKYALDMNHGSVFLLSFEGKHIGNVSSLAGLPIEQPIIHAEILETAPPAFPKTKRVRF